MMTRAEGERRLRENVVMKVAGSSRPRIRKSWGTDLFYPGSKPKGLGLTVQLGGEGGRLYLARAVSPYSAGRIPCVFQFRQSAQPRLLQEHVVRRSFLQG